MVEFLEVLLVCAALLTGVGFAIKYRLWRYFWFPLAAFCVIVLIETAYDWEFVRPYPHEISVDKYEWKDSTIDTQAALKDVNARIGMETIEFLRGVAVVWVFLVSLYVVVNSWRNASSSQLWNLIFIGIIATVIYGVFWENIIPGTFTNPWTSQLFGKLISEANNHSPRPDFMKEIGFSVVKATHFALIFAAFATGLVMLKPGEDELTLRSQEKYLIHLLFSCAVLCVIHVISMGTWNLREVALLKDPAEAQLVVKMCAIIAAENAVAYTCILIAFHLPATEVVISQIKDVMPRDAKQSAEKRKKWLDEHQLSDSMRHFYAQILAMLSPLLAGAPVVKLFSIIFSP